jgi:hypothetical protein
MMTKYIRAISETFEPLALVLVAIAALALSQALIHATAIA